PKEDPPAEYASGRFQIGIAGTWDILWDALRNFRNNGDVNQAAAIAFYAILSIIPLFILTMIVADDIFRSDPNVQIELTRSIQRLHPYFSGDLLLQVGQIEQKKQLLGWVGLFGLIWLAAAIFNSLETSFHIIFRSETSRNYFVSKLLAVSMIPLGWMIAVASIAITYVATIIFSQPLFRGDLAVLTMIEGMLFRFLLPFLLTVFFFTILYRVIPTVKVPLNSAIIGGLTFAALMEIAKHFFTWYVNNYTRYDIIFGSLETVVILVIWVFYVALILLFCAEFIASYQRRDLILIERALLKSPGRHLQVDERLFRKFGRVYPKGSYIFREEDASREMYYILQGRVCMEKKAGHVQKVLNDFGPGEYFGEIAALIEAPRTASARAVETSHVAAISGSTFRELLRQSGEVSLFMLKELSYRLRHTNDELEELTQSWIRLKSILFFLKEWPLESDVDPKVELARHTEKSEEEIHEVLLGLADQGILTLRDGVVVGFEKELVWDLLKTDVFR
ncbi:MAG: YihY family inner membrane protein, partial [Deltaproteobacteria bacterium]|nr:YihY family inner membrane protein [Deltaproteobacteria bacterium]